jgi:hypothetical protein
VTAKELFSVGSDPAAVTLTMPTASANRVTDVRLFWPSHSPQGIDARLSWHDPGSASDGQAPHGGWRASWAPLR